MLVANCDNIINYSDMTVQVARAVYLFHQSRSIITHRIATRTRSPHSKDNLCNMCKARCQSSYSPSLYHL